MSRVVVEKNIAFDDVRKKFYVTCYFGNGKKSTKTSSTLREARQILKEYEADKIRENVVEPKNITVAEWLQYWLDNIIKPSRAESTYYQYNVHIQKHINPVLGKIKLQKLKPVDVQKWLTEQSKVIMRTGELLSSNTIRKHYDTLNEAMKTAVKQEYLIRNPVEKVDAPKKHKDEAPHLDYTAIIKLLELINGKRDIEIGVYFALLCSLRREETYGLQWRDIDFENSCFTVNRAVTQVGKDIVIKEPKTAKSKRTLALPDSLKLLLLTEKEKQEQDKKDFGDGYISSDWVIRRSDGSRLKPNHWSEKIISVMRDYPDIFGKTNYHSLRHTYASIAHLQGVPVGNISISMGHSNINTTLTTYTHMFGAKDSRETINAVESLISSLIKT